MIELLEYVEGALLPYDLDHRDGLMEFAADLALKRFTMDGEVPPLFIFVSPAGKGVAMVAPQWGSDDDKDRICARLRRLFKAVGSPRYAMLSEAWMATVDEHTEAAVAKLAPTDRNDRREVVQVIVCEPNRQPVSRMWDIIRSDGKPVLAERTGDGYESMGGRMAEILDD